MQNGQHPRTSRPRHRKREAEPSTSLEQLIQDLEGLERLQSLQSQLIREIRSQVAELQNESP